MSPPRINALFVIGTRPEAIKMLPLVAAARDSTWLNPVVISTGQHTKLVADVLAIDGLAPDITLELPRERSLNGLFAAVVQGIDDALSERFGPPLRPDDAPYSAG